jgi:hypothetical protein
MRRIGATSAGTMGAALCFLLWLAGWGTAGPVNQCRECHTTPARLVPAVRECVKAAASLPGPAQASEGEG